MPEESTLRVRLLKAHAEGQPFNLTPDEVTAVVHAFDDAANRPTHAELHAEALVAALARKPAQSTALKPSSREVLRPTGWIVMRDSFPVAFVEKLDHGEEIAKALGHSCPPPALITYEGMRKLLEVFIGGRIELPAPGEPAPQKPPKQITLGEGVEVVAEVIPLHAEKMVGLKVNLTVPQVRDILLASADATHASFMIRFRNSDGFMNFVDAALGAAREVWKEVEAMWNDVNTPEPRPANDMLPWKGKKR